MPGRAAFRVGDSTSLGGIALQSSNSTVFINGKPAMRVGDLTSGPAKVSEGDPTVFIEGSPLAATGDLISDSSSAIGGSEDVFLA